MLYGLSMATVICWLVAFPGGLIMALLFFRTKFWKKLNDYYSEWNITEKE